MFGKNLQLNPISTLVVLMITLSVPFSAQADIHTWTGDAGSRWSNPANWSSSSAPVAMDSVLIGGGNNLPVYDNAQVVPLSHLLIDQQGSLELSGDYTLVTMDEYIGYDGEGSFTQDGGSHNVMGPLYLGYLGQVTETWLYPGSPPTFAQRFITPGGTGTYTLNSGTLLTMGEIIGVNGTGVFTQNGGFHTVTGSIVLGREGESGSVTQQDFYGETCIVDTDVSESSGTYMLNGGVLQANTISKGDGASTLIINGGTLNVITGNILVDDLIIGGSAGSDGSYTQSAGTVKVGTEIIGNAGKGTYVQTGGTHRATGLILGGEGTYELSGSGVLKTNYLEIHGTFHQIGGTSQINSACIDIRGGTFNQDGATHTASEMYLDGKPEDGIGIYHLTDGVLRVTGTEKIGYTDDSTGFFIQDGGTHTVNRLDVGSGAISLWFGSADDSWGFVAGQGTYTLTDGNLTVDTECIGYIGNGTFNQDGGTHIIKNDLTFGHAFGSGSYALNGGTFSVNSIVLNGFDAKLSIDGGSLSVGTGNIHLTEFYLGEKAGTSGSYTQSNGIITVGIGTIGTETIGKYGTGDFTQNGGTHTVTDVLSLGRRAGSDGTYTLNDGDLTVDNRELVGFYGTGTFNQTGGSHTVANKLFLGYGASGQGTYTLDGGDLTAGQEQIGRDGSGTFVQTGGTNTVTGNLSVGTTGEYTQTGGSLNAGKITNSGRFTSSGGTLTVGSSGIQNSGYMQLASRSNQIGGSVSNSGTMEIKNTTTFTGGITNTNTFKTTNTAITVNGTYTENAAFISNGSTSTMETLVVNATGHLKGGAADEWIIHQNFENLSLENLLWDTRASALTFSGNTAHEFFLAGADFGADMAGYLDNFAWDCLNIEGTLTLFDSNSISGGALYVNSLTGLQILEGTITNILFGDTGNDYLNIYYLADLTENDFLGGLTYDLANGGSLIGISAHSSVPVPGSFLLMLSGMLVLLKIKRGSLQS